MTGAPPHMALHACAGVGAQVGEHVLAHLTNLTSLDMDTLTLEAMPFIGRLSRLQSLSCGGCAFWRGRGRACRADHTVSDLFEGGGGRLCKVKGQPATLALPIMRWAGTRASVRKAMPGAQQAHTHTQR